jgi:hypothetical protein
MYIAELRGKLSERNERSEDILTSNVFSLFKYAKRRVFLKSFFNMMSLELSDDDADNAEFQFWPKYADKTEPDLVIIAGKYYLLIEAKYFSSFEWSGEKESSQLSREIKGGLYEAKSLNKEFYLAAVTADYVYKPDDFRKVREAVSFKNLVWINWQRIYILLISILEEKHLTLEDRLFCQDLCSLLEQKNLRPFRDIKSVSTEIDFEPIENIFLASATLALRGDFIGFVRTLTHVESMASPPDTVFLETGHHFSFLEDFEDLQQLGSDIFFKRGT